MSLAGEKADPGGPGGGRGGPGGKTRRRSKTAAPLGSVLRCLRFGTCEECDLCACPHSGFGSECIQCGKGVGCPCVSGSDGAHLRTSYQTLSNKGGVRVRGPWHLGVTSLAAWAGHRGRCRSCC